MCVQPFDLISLCDLSQLGSGPTSNRNTPVGVVGLSSGVSSISLGEVRFVFVLLVVQMLRCNTAVFILLVLFFN
jgi:hypothetical protein